MLGYMPEIYPDKLLYSWISRYYSHNGYPGYRQALEDLLVEGNGKIHFEFAGHFNVDAMKVISSMYCIVNYSSHTFPIMRIRQLRTKTKLYLGLVLEIVKVDSCAVQNDKVHHRPKFCPLCSLKTKKNMEKHISIEFIKFEISACAKHQCKLVETQ